MISDLRFRVHKLPLIIFSFSATLACILSYGEVLGWQRAKYTASAHGSSSSGVKRKAGNATSDYWQGNCAHCHEQHASINDTSHPPYVFGLFAESNPDSQTENFCFQCHKGVGSVQDSPGGIINNTFSNRFGGGTVTFTTIYEAFNPTSGDTPSSHSLSDIQRYVAGRAGFSTNVNACIACHDPHTAQKNYDPVVVDPVLGGVNTAIRRPLDYAQRPTNLWGDENVSSSGYNERMIDATINYQAPFYVGIGDPYAGPFEPANDNTGDGSNLPNYARFCYDCHNKPDVYSTERGRNLITIEWEEDKDRHGQSHEVAGVVGLGVTVAPYGDENYNYVLSCTDCHEPHGSENEWLLRTCVNGKDNISVPSSGQWLDFCTACHTILYPHWDSPPDCYSNGYCHQHGNFSRF